MKNSHSKKFFSCLAFFVCAFSLGIVFAVSAEDSSNETTATNEQKMFWLQAKERAEERKAQVEKNWEEKKAMIEENKEARQETLCERLSERSERVQARISERAQKIAERKTKRTDAFGEKRASRDATLEDRRKERDSKRAEMYARLMEKAGDDAVKKSAVTAFQTAVEQAVSDRKEAIDSAIAEFRTNVDAVVSSKKNALETGIASYESTVQAAFETALDSCNSGEDPGTVHSTLEAALQSARENAKDKRAAVENVGQHVKALSETKREAFADALSDFKTALEKARADLKTALGSLQKTGEMSE